MSTSLQTLHDKVLALKPADVEHNTVEDPCPFCVKAEVLKAAAEGTNTDETPKGGSMSTFTQEEVDAAVAEAVSKAVSPLQDRVNELETASKDTEVGSAVAAAVAEKDAAIADLQTKLDDAEARAAAAETAKAEVDAWWADAIAAEEAAREIASKRETRVEELKDAKVFADEYVDEHADRFAAMADDDWAARMDEWKAVAAAKATEEKIPGYTGFQARDESGANTGSALSEIGGLRRALVDPRTL